MRTLLFFILLASSVFSETLAQRPGRTYNFKKLEGNNVNPSELEDKIRRHSAKVDSLFFAEKMDSIYQLYNYLNTSTTSYSAFTLHSEYISTDLAKFNAELSAYGIGPIDDGLYTFGYGFTIKHKRFLYEYLLNIFFGNKTKSDNVTVKVGGGSFVNVNFGFDVLNLPRFQLYPMVGISQQSTEVKYYRKPANGSAIGSYPELLMNTSSTNIEKNQWNATAAVELDFHLKYSERGGGTIIGLRYGVAAPFYEGKYKSDKTKIAYDPKITLRESYLSLLIKFYGRNKIRRNNI